MPEFKADRQMHSWCAHGQCPDSRYNITFTQHRLKPMPAQSRLRAWTKSPCCFQCGLCWMVTMHQKSEISAANHTCTQLYWRIQTIPHHMLMVVKLLLNSLPIPVLRLSEVCNIYNVLTYSTHIC